jgi:hypothetical protein
VRNLFQYLACKLGYHRVSVVVRSGCGNPAYDIMFCRPCQRLGKLVLWDRKRIPKRCLVVVTPSDPPPNVSYARYVSGLDTKDNP